MHNAKNTLRALDRLEPPDLWDDVHRRSPGSDRDSLPARRGRWLVIVVAFALTAGATSFAIRALTSDTGGKVASLNTSTWHSRTIDELGLAYIYPPQWHVQPFSERVGHVGFAGVVLSNGSSDLRHPAQPNSATSAWDLSELAADGVVISIEHVFALSDGQEPDSRFPLSLGDAEVVSAGKARAGTQAFLLQFGAHGHSDYVRSWFGPEASRHDQQVARLIVAGISLAGPSTELPNAALDPVAICDVPEYDPNVAVLGDDFSSVFGEVGPRTFPLGLLEAAGDPGSTIQGAAADALRLYLASPEARNAPADGWRAIDETADEVIFAAPPNGGYSDWWVVRFEREGEVWHPRETELVDQSITPAQRGHQLELSWSGDVAFEDGSWNSGLILTNDRERAWSADEQAPAIWGQAHVFDAATGMEVGRTAQTVGEWGTGISVPASDSVEVPLSLGGQLGALDPGAFDVVACVPQLGLASPVGSLRVIDEPTTTNTRVLTYSYTGIAMTALGGGILVDHNGCLAVAESQDDPRPTYVLWPDGYALVTRDGRTVLIDAVGTEVAQMGDEIQLGGGYGSFEGAIGDVPESCRSGGQGYFIAGGPA
ncbi:MAG TPA: hypothetical protein VH989_09465 [Actinomycetota bacterium]|jgi:hypothetical protein